MLFVAQKQDKLIDKSQYYKGRQNHPASTVERVEVVNDIVKTEETERVGYKQAKEDDESLILWLRKRAKVLTCREEICHAVADNFKR